MTQGENMQDLTKIGKFMESDTDMETCYKAFKLSIEVIQSISTSMLWEHQEENIQELWI